MKTILNILITVSVLVIMSDCEANAGKAELNYTNSIFAGFGLVTFGFFRIYYKEFTEFLTKYQ